MHGIMGQHSAQCKYMGQHSAQCYADVVEINRVKPPQKNRVADDSLRVANNVDNDLAL